MIVTARRSSPNPEAAMVLHSLHDDRTDRISLGSSCASSPALRTRNAFWDGMAYTRFGLHLPKLNRPAGRLHGAHIADCQGPAFSVAEAFDMIEHVSFGFVAPLRYVLRVV